jgi:hypothetical protein
MLCAYLSVALLLGLEANALFGLWWADPVTALVVAGVAIKEGRESWRGETCCAADAGLDTADSHHAVAIRTARAVSTSDRADRSRFLQEPAVSLFMLGTRLPGDRSGYIRFRRWRCYAEAGALAKRDLHLLTAPHGSC